MDRKPSSKTQIERLIRQSEDARAFLGAEAAILRQRLDLPARLRGSLKSHPGGWMLGSLASGLAASLLLRRRPAAAPRKRRGLPAILLGLGMTAARPMLKAWLADQLKIRLSGALSHAPSTARRPSPPSQAH